MHVQQQIAPKAQWCYWDSLLISACLQVRFAAQSPPQHAKKAYFSYGSKSKDSSTCKPYHDSHALQACKNTYAYTSCSSYACSLTDSIALHPALHPAFASCLASCRNAALLLSKATSECRNGMPCSNANNGTIIIAFVYFCLGSISARENNLQMSMTALMTWPASIRRMYRNLQQKPISTLYDC